MQKEKALRRIKDCIFRTFFDPLRFLSTSNIALVLLKRSLGENKRCPRRPAHVSRRFSLARQKNGRIIFLKANKKCKSVPNKKPIYLKRKISFSTYVRNLYK